MSQENQRRAVKGQVVVNASLDQVWRAWSMSEGAQAFFAPRCTIEAWPGGKYEILFNPDEAPGKQGSEGMIVLAVQAPQMLSFTWNAPPELPSVRGQMTHVMVFLDKLSPAQTMVTLKHDGWGEGGEWEAARKYFESAWLRVVLPRLKYRFEVGPMSWDCPPDLS